MSLKFSIPFLPLGCEYSDLRSQRTYCKLCRFIAAARLFYSRAKSGVREREKEASSVGHINKCKKPQFHIFLSATPCVVYKQRDKSAERELYQEKLRHSAENSSRPVCILALSPRQRLFWNYRWSSTEQALELQFIVSFFNALNFSSP